MSGTNRPWPPLIVAAHVPRSVRWRDAVLTFLAWATFVLLLDIQFEWFVGEDIARLLSLSADPESNWPPFLAALMPFVLIAATLCTILAIFGLRTVVLRRQALRLPQPAPLEASDEARRAGLDEATLVAARGERIVIVHIDADGRHRIEVAGGG